MKKSINPVWGGRFKKDNSELLKKINNSISFDYELAFQCGAAAHNTELGENRLTRAAPWHCCTKVSSDPCKTRPFWAGSNLESRWQDQARLAEQLEVDANERSE